MDIERQATAGADGLRCGCFSDVLTHEHQCIHFLGERTSAVAKCGQAFKLSVLGRGGIDVEVMWAEDGKAGLRFAKTLEATDGRTPRNAAVPRGGAAPCAGFLTGYHPPE